jgi:hypothetical protein
MQCGLPRSTISFPHYLINGTIFEKKLLNIKFVSWFSLQLLSETFFILRINERDMIKKNVYIGLHVKFPLFLSDLKETWHFSKDFSKKILEYQISWKSVQWDSSSMRTGGQTDKRFEVNGRFPQFLRTRLKAKYVYVSNTKFHRWINKYGTVHKENVHFYVSVEIGPGAHPASYTMGAGAPAWGQNCRDVELTTHSLLLPTLKRDRCTCTYPAWHVTWWPWSLQKRIKQLTVGWSEMCGN